MMARRLRGAAIPYYSFASTASALDALSPGPGSGMSASTVPSRRIIA